MKPVIKIDYNIIIFGHRTKWMGNKLEKSMENNDPVYDATRGKMGHR